MNTQRWIALGMLVLIGVCIGTSNLWLASSEEEEEPTPTPTETPEEDLSDADQEATAIALLTVEPEATLNPVIVELLGELQIESLGAGDDPYVIMAGDFTVIDALHRGEGVASVYRITEQQRVLRLDPFSVTNGPDLHVVLSPHEIPRTSADALLPIYIDLGVLKNTSGSQNYEIAENINLADYKSVVIYSFSFNIIYSTAPLTPVRGQN